MVKEEEISGTSGLEYSRMLEYDSLDNLYNSVTSDIRTLPFYHTKNNPLNYAKTSVWEDDFLPASYTYTFDKENKTVQVEITDEFGDITSYSIAFEEK